MPEMGNLYDGNNKWESVTSLAEPDDRFVGANEKTDAWAIFIIFCALVLSAVHFISGWTFDFV